VDTQVSTFDLSKTSGTVSLPKLLAISEQKKSGLILCKQYHAEFAGPGAAVNCLTEQAYRAVIAIGSPELIPLLTPDDRRRAYGRRIQWGRWLQKILEQPDPLIRAEKLLSGFEEFFGRQVVLSLPSEVLALLSGVFSGTVEAVRSQHWRETRPSSLSFLTGSDQLKVTTISHSPQQEVHEVPLLTSATVTEIEQTYAVLYSA
jgi:hypothetical protein